MRRTNKKGFTIVELVIVIAVIAILAAVLIPTFSSLVKKANESADIQAVRQMNTALATYSDGSIANVADAINALDKENIALENYKPIQKDHYFYFYTENGTPKIVYTDKDNNVVFPEDAKISGVQLMSLSGSTPESDEYKKDIIKSEGTATITISNGAELTHLMNNINDYYVDSSVTTISITLDGNVDMKGSTASFGEVKKNFTLNGGGYTISGGRTDRNSEVGSYNDQAKNYGYGLFNIVDSGASVTLENVTFSDMVVRDTGENGYAFGHSAVLFGRVEGTVSVKDVNIKNCTVYGGGKTGSVIGYLPGEATLENVTVENTNIYGLAFVAKVVGAVSDTATSLNINQVTCTNVTTGVYAEKWMTMYNGDTNWITGSQMMAADAKAYLDNSTNTYVPYERNSIEGFEPITTEDYYWTMVWVDGIVSYNGGAYRAEKSGNDSYTPS